MTYPCIICEGPARVPGGLCLSCLRAYDRFNSSDDTTIGLIGWVANRARAALRKKLKKLVEKPVSRA